ncbi:MAG: HAMP domain-containing histidine kinase [Bacteroidetes bacterium]|nr:HAMP domain-containing histidine kinase [Bacteroidota bacterium]
MPPNKNSSSNFIFITGLSLSLIIFAIDLLTPLGVADGIWYVGVMLLSMWANDKRYIVISALTGVVLIISGYFFSPPASVGAVAYIAIANRLLSIMVVITCAIVIVRYKKIERKAIEQHEVLQQLTADLKESNFYLEERVKERTVVLENALKNLKKSEEELQKSLEHEKELNELKTRFVSTASHEFRTPLATILSSLSLVSKYGEQNEKAKQNRHIDRIKSAVVHLTDILNDILSVSKLEEGGMTTSLEQFSIYNAVSDVVREMLLVAQPGQKIEYHHFGQDEIILDKKILKHILLNLISNSIKFSKEDCRISIKSEALHSNLILKVEDNGMGISDEDQVHLFERFFRGENVSAIQGTGLGLNIVAKYVELLNGKIDFTSKLGEGTTFIIKFDLNESVISSGQREMNLG